MFVEDDPLVVDLTIDNKLGLDGEGNGKGTGVGCVGMQIMSTQIWKWPTNATRNGNGDKWDGDALCCRRMHQAVAFMQLSTADSV